jgi:membrane-associated phospholipid phosphatase
VLNTFFKFVFARARPLFTDPLVTVISYSFPSGRVASSTLFYGFVAALLISHTSATGRRVAAVIGALLMIILVAASRMYPLDSRAYSHARTADTMTSARDCRPPP